MAGPQELTRNVLQAAKDLQFDPVGVCDAAVPESIDHFKKWVSNSRHGTMSYLERSVALRSDPGTLLPGVQSIVAVALGYNQPNPRAPGQPRIAKYALGRDYHKVLRTKIKKLASKIEEWLPDACCRICVDSAPVLEREYAQRAGLGWFGKNTCLIHSQKGSFFVIGLLLTTAKLEPTSPAIGGCGKCRLCIDACPTGAIVQDNGVWQVDSPMCVSYLTIEHKGPISVDTRGIGDWTFGCDVCQDVCPFNQPRERQPERARLTDEPGFLATRNWPSLVQILELGTSDWDVLTRGSPVRRAGIEGLKRNARINLENAGLSVPVASDEASNETA